MEISQSNSNNISNTSDMIEHTSPTGDVRISDVNESLSILFIFASFTICLANFGTIVAFLKDTNLQEKPSDVLILTLSCIDVLQGLVLVPLHLSYYAFGQWMLGEPGCKAYVTMAYASVTFNLLLVGAISLDRVLLVGMEYPRYVKYQSKRRILCGIACCLGVSLIPAVVDIAVWDFAKSNNAIAAGIDFDYVCLSPTRWMPQISLAFLFVFLLIPVLLVAVLSVAFLVLLRRRLNKKRVGITNEEDSTRKNSTSGASTSVERAHQRTRNRYVRPAIILGALVVAMGISVLPYLSYVFIVVLACPACHKPQIVYILALLLYCKPLFDGVLYGVTERKMRRFYKSVFRGLLKCFTR